MILLSLLLACGNPGPAPSQPTEPTALNQRVNMSVDEFAKVYDPNADLLIDVRTPEEFAAGHVPGAYNVPLDSLTHLSEAVATRAPDQKLYVICAVGGRSAKATDRLVSAGIVDAVNVDGGTNGYAAMGLPLQTVEAK